MSDHKPQQPRTAPLEDGVIPAGASNRPVARKRLIEAGVDVFGEMGYDRASTRMLAERAGVNLASIRYYFKGKEGLYSAVVEHIVEKSTEAVGPVLSHIRTRLDTGDVSQASAREMVRDLLGAMTDFMVGSSFAPRFARIIMREQLAPSAAYDIIYTSLMRDILQALEKLVAAVTGDGDSRRCALRAHILLGHVLPFRVARETVVRYVGMEGYTQEEIEELRDLINDQALAALDGLAAAQEHGRTAQ